ncbi:hypothetical protein V1477_010512 [Vespula maculifrons]|uniref:Uncharacterized protein n=1 Tax=Vespula maculifrons TaxID=7453 RepID=A0ABD2C4S0_VESMC
MEFRTKPTSAEERNPPKAHIRGPLPRTQFQYIASTTDPGPTAWRLLHLGTHGLTQSNVVHIGRTFIRAREHHVSARRQRRESSSYPSPIDYETNISTIYGITHADMSKSMNWRRSRREREEKKAGTCAHVKGIVSGRKIKRHIRNVTRARVRTMKWKRKGGHRYENRARFFDTERGKPAQKPTPTSPTHSSHPKEVRIINLEYLFPSTEKMFETIKDFGKILKNAAVRKVILAAYKISTYNKYFRSRSHRVEVAAAGDPRTNGDSTLKSTIRDAFPLWEIRASQQTGDNAPPSTPSASDISRHDRSCLFRYFKEKSKSSVGLNLAIANTHACVGRHASECFPYHSRTEAIRHTLPAYNKNYMQRGSINFHISIFRKYYRPGSHRLEVAAAGDPRTNGDSTLKSTIRDAFPLRELRASQETGVNAPTSTPSASDISRHDRSCLYFDFINQNVVPGRT